MSEQTAVAVVPLQAPKLPTIQAGGAVRAIVPQDFDSAWRIANAVVKAGMAPRGLETPEKAMVAIMHGLEVGLTPMNALQSIAVVNGRPTVWGDGAIGLARGSGLLEWMEERFEGQGDDYVAVCLVKRRGEPKPVRGDFSVADAKRAGLWGKQGPWQQYSKRMLQMRARAFALRDGFADVLKGLSIKEEVDDIPAGREAPPPRDVTPPRVPSPPLAVPSPPAAVETTDPQTGEVTWEDASDTATAEPTRAPPPPIDDDIPPGLRRNKDNTLAEPAKKAPAPAPDVEAFDSAGWRRDAEGALSGCEDSASLFDVHEKIMRPAKGKASIEDWQAVALEYRKTFDRVSAE